MNHSIVAILGGMVMATAACAGGADRSPRAPSPSGVASPPELVVTCTAGGAFLASPTVAARPDGVHFRLIDLAGGQTFLFVETIDGGGGQGGTQDGILVATIPTGAARLKCVPEGKDSDQIPWTRFEILDPSSLFVSDQLECRGEWVQARMDSGEGATGPHGDPVAIARGTARNLHPGDSIERAGYPASAGSDATVRLVRGLRVISVVTFRPDGFGGWLSYQAGRCALEGAGW